jgi:preprotein translocase subunit SecE
MREERASWEGNPWRAIAHALALVFVMVMFVAGLFLGVAWAFHALMP